MKTNWCAASAIVALAVVPAAVVTIYLPAPSHADGCAVPLLTRALMSWRRRHVGSPRLRPGMCRQWKAFSHRTSCTRPVKGSS